MKRTLAFVGAVALVLPVAMMTGCPKKDEATKAGEKAGEAVKKTGEAAKAAGEAVKGAAESMPK